MTRKKKPIPIRECLLMWNSHDLFVSLVHTRSHGAQESDSNLVMCQNGKPLSQISHIKSINHPFWNLFDTSYMISDILTVLSHQLMCPCMHVHPLMAWYLFSHPLLLATMPQVTQVASMACVENIFEQLHPGDKVLLVTTVSSSTRSLNLTASTGLALFASCCSSRSSSMKRPIHVHLCAGFLVLLRNAMKIQECGWFSQRWTKTIHQVFLLFILIAFSVPHTSFPSMVMTPLAQYRHTTPLTSFLRFM